MDLLYTTASVLLDTVFDVLPIVVVVFTFQFLILRQRPANLRKILIGLLYVLAGMALFIVGLELSLFPLGRIMATQLTTPEFLTGGERTADWLDYIWVYVFAAAIGFSTTVAEPSLIAVSIKAEEISGGNVSAWGLRVAVAVGVAIGITVGAYRIVVGHPLPYYIMVGYAVVIVQTLFVSRTIIPLAYDSGGVTTSTITVPVVAALGLGLASAIEGRSALIDGFGLIAFASLFPIMSVLGYSLLTERVGRRKKIKREDVKP